MSRFLKIDTDSKRLLFFAITVVWFFSLGSVQAKTPDQCDPRREGFWENIGCQKHWRERIRVREERLEFLRSQHNVLVDENVELKEQIRVSRETIEFLENELEPSRQRLEALSRVRLTQQNHKRQFAAVAQELAFLAKGLDAATQARLGCTTKEYERVIAVTKPRTSLGREAAEFALSYAATEYVGYELEKAAPQRLKAFTRNAFDLVSGIATVIDVFQRVERLSSYTTEYQTYTEEKTYCQ